MAKTPRSITAFTEAELKERMRGFLADTWDEGFRARFVALTTDPPKRKTNPYRATEKEV